MRGFGTFGLVIWVWAALFAVGCDDARPLNAAGEIPEGGADADVGGGGSSGGTGGTVGRGDEPVPPGGICGPGNSRCVEGRLQTCQPDAVSYLVETCPDGSVCEAGACIVRLCTPGAVRCGAGGVQRCAADGAAWSEPTPCADERTCFEGACVTPACRAGETACAAKMLLTCDEDGVHWTRTPCPEATRCIDGECRADVGGGDCPPGEILCGPGGMRVCTDEGDGWVERPCTEGQACYEGRCVDCVRDENCAESEICDDGTCAPAPLRITTESLPVGQVGVPYDAALEASGGTPPYTFRLEVGRLPAGLEVDPDGRLRGTPEGIAETDLTLAVDDADGASDARQLRLRVVGAGASLEITTASPLPETEEGSPYEVQFEAIGGTAPYGFFLVSGALPAGLILDATGRLGGSPTEVGRFEFRLRAVDAAVPPGFAEKDFVLQVAVAPLEIYGEQELNLFVTKLITLPLITVIANVPIPYETRLTARGGLRPYTFAEEALPAAVAGFVPNSGLPDGLTLEADGRLHGAVVDPTQVVEVAIPFTMIRLTGFFFAAGVSDSQNPAATSSAIFILPTLPLGG